MAGKLYTYFLNFLSNIIGSTSSHYGHDHILKLYSKYPRFLPLHAQIQHGWYADDIPDLWKEKKIPYFLVWNERIKANWEKKSKKKAYILGAPFVLFRNIANIKKKHDARGTVVFPNHSTPSQIEQYDVMQYCDELEALPDRFKPITVCLHFRDVDRYGPDFMKRGFEVVTAGDSRQREGGFVRRFYEILSRHKYCSSNEVGSYTFYSIEMGIPFFIYGPECVSVRRSDTEQVIEKNQFRVEARDLFKEMKEEPSEVQRSFVELELGVKTRLSPRALRALFIRTLLIYEIPRYPLRLCVAICSASLAIVRKLSRNFFGHASLD